MNYFLEQTCTLDISSAKGQMYFFLLDCAQPWDGVTKTYFHLYPLRVNYYKENYGEKYPEAILELKQMFVEAQNKPIMVKLWW